MPKVKVIMYADKITESMQEAMDETARRRSIQMEYNEKHGIVPKTIIKPIHDVVRSKETKEMATKYLKKKKLPAKQKGKDDQRIGAGNERGDSYFRFRKSGTIKRYLI